MVGSWHKEMEGDMEKLVVHELLAEGMGLQRNQKLYRNRNHRKNTILQQGGSIDSNYGNTWLHLTGKQFIILQRGYKVP